MGKGAAIKTALTYIKRNESGAENEYFHKKKPIKADYR